MKDCQSTIKFKEHDGVVIDAEIGYCRLEKNQPMQIVFYENTVSFYSADFEYKNILKSDISYKYRLITDFYTISFNEINIAVIQNSMNEFEKLLG